MIYIQLEKIYINYMFLINTLNTQRSKIDFQSQSGYGNDLFLSPIHSRQLRIGKNVKSPQCKFTAKREKGVKKNFKNIFSH